MQLALNFDTETNSYKSLSRTINEQARKILGKTDSKLATFSFSGKNPNAIVLNSKYAQGQTTLKYSIDSWASWVTTQEKIVTLTPSEINQLDYTKGILVQLESSQSSYKITLGKSTLNIDNYYFNNLEGKLFGNIELLEYSLDNGLS